MLVLSRNRHQRVIITVPPSPVARKIVATVVEVRGDKVRLGLAADKDVEIHREEIYEKLTETESAA